MAPEFGPKGFAGLGQPAPMRYDTVVTETAADHAILSTGTYAELNGVPGNSFRIDGRLREAVDDPACPVWGAPRLGKSASALRVPTVGDALKLNTDGAARVVSVAVKDRSALFLAGPSADLALWWETETGEMASTTCYAPGAPQWVPRQLAAPFKDWVWTMSRPDVVTRLVPEARAAGAVPRNDIGPEFPHKVGQGKIDKQLFLNIRATPAGTSIALKAARAALQAFSLGDRDTTDLFAVAVSAPDGIGHQFGTVARERADTILRTHAELSAFLDELRAHFGPRLSILLTADHGVTPPALDEQRLRVSQGGTVNIDEILARVDRALQEQIGPREGGWVGGIEGSALSLKPPFPARAVEVATQLLRQEPGFWRVVPESEIAQAEPAIRHAYFAGRSSQILLVPRPLWTLKKPVDGADHGSPWNDDALVPLLVQAQGYRFRRDVPFRATQVAPTVATLLHTAPPAAALDAPAIEQE